MSANQSKNDIAWETLFKQENILDRIQHNGFFEISSTKINQQREARLMTKFDHALQLPKIFRKHGLTIQPTSRGGYIIGAFDSYFQLPKPLSVSPIYRQLPVHIQTLEPSGIYSESSAILSAFISGMIDDVLGEKTYFTVLGRMSTGTFDYQIKDTKTNITHQIQVRNSQCEIDGGFEGDSKFTLIEAKCETVDDFIIRQLYYPYRLWTAKTTKQVVPIFLSISNDLFSFYCFRFHDPGLYNSIELVSQHRYCLSQSDINLSDLRNIVEKTPIVPELDRKIIPFPQADNFTRIVDLLGRLYNAKEPLSKDEITLIYAFDQRQTDYYVSAARYLGLVSKENSGDREVKFSLSSRGTFILSQHPQRRHLELVKCILSHQVFNQSLRLYLDSAEPPSLKAIVAIMKQHLDYAPNTLRRRAQTVKGWIEWIVQLTTR